jgi:lipoprotein-anchoring transpeptidase ErfK/SrfK
MAARRQRSPSMPARTTGALALLVALAGLATWWATLPEDEAAVAGGQSPAQVPLEDPASLPPATSATPAAAERALEPARIRTPDSPRSLAARADSLQEVGRAVLDEARPLEERDSLARRLPELWAAEIRTGAASPFFRAEAVQRGDSYWRIARRLSVAGVTAGPGLLQEINGVPPEALQAGSRILVPAMAVSLLADLEDRRLHLLFGEVAIATMPAGIGRDGRTRPGSYRIGEKIREPDWRDPATGRSLRFGEPGHRIGTRWLGFHQEGRPTSLGIHGTDEPDTVGRAESDGCLRLRQLDLESLFERVAEGTPVRIRP